MRGGTFVVLMLGASMLTCGGDYDVSACEGQVQPLMVPAPSADIGGFQAMFGTALFLDGPPYPILEIFLTPDSNACPLEWATGSTATHDVRVLGIIVTAVNAQQVIGSYSFGVGISDLAVVSMFIPKGATESTSDVAATDGTITITNYELPTHVAGNFVANFPDGTALTSTFDVPFCSKACGARIDY
jgi:hypothetical protein